MPSTPSLASLRMFSHGNVPSMYLIASLRNSPWASARTLAIICRCCDVISKVMQRHASVGPSPRKDRIDEAEPHEREVQGGPAGARLTLAWRCMTFEITSQQRQMIASV